MGTCDEVEHLRNGAEGLIVGVFVFINDELISILDGCSTQGWNCALFISSKGDIDGIEEF